MFEESKFLSFHILLGIVLYSGVLLSLIGMFRMTFFISPRNIFPITCFINLLFNATVFAEFSITPEYVNLKPGQSVNFAVHGLIDTFEVSDDTIGSWTRLSKDDGPGITYTAPEQLGFYTLTFYPSDNPQKTYFAHVNVYSPIKAKKTTIFLEDYETTSLEVIDGVPPYSWIEGGKGTLTEQGQERSLATYTPGEIIGSETISIYDNTGERVDIEVTVKGAFRVSPIQHSICLDKVTQTFQASGGEAPYHIRIQQKGSEAPSQDGWKKIGETEDSLTLQFTQADLFEVVASDGTNTVKIASLDVETCEDTRLKLEPQKPIYRYVQPNTAILPSISVSIISETATQIDWICQGACTIDDLNTTTGKSVTFFTPAEGHYELHAQDQSGRTGIVKIHVASDIVSLYADTDKKLNDIEMQTALDDFFQVNNTFCCSNTQFYHLIETFMTQEGCDLDTM